MLESIGMYVATSVASGHGTFQIESINRDVFVS